MKNKERLRAIVREWIEDKLGFELTEETANDIVDNIIGHGKGTKVVNNNENDEFVLSSNGESYPVRKPKEEFPDYGLIHHELVSKHRKNAAKEPKEESDWISVKDRMPKKVDYGESDFVMIRTLNGEIKKAFSHREIFYTHDSKFHNKDVTHWMPIKKEPEFTKEALKAMQVWCKLNNK